MLSAGSKPWISFLQPPHCYSWFLIWKRGGWGGGGSHSIVGWSPTSLRHYPVDILAGVLDVARLTVDAVLSIDLQPHSLSQLQGNVLVYTYSRRERGVGDSFKNWTLFMTNFNAAMKPITTMEFVCPHSLT